MLHTIVKVNNHDELIKKAFSVENNNTAYMLKIKPICEEQTGYMKYREHNVKDKVLQIGLSTFAIPLIESITVRRRKDEYYREEIEYRVNASELFSLLSQDAKSQIINNKVCDEDTI
jgi:hypothetical protein